MDILEKLGLGLLKAISKTDSIEIGSQTHGRIKVYVDADDPEGGKKRIDNQVEMLKHAKDKMKELRHEE